MIAHQKLLYSLKLLFSVLKKYLFLHGHKFGLKTFEADSSEGRGT